MKTETTNGHEWTQRGLRPQPKVAITLRRDEHLSVDIHQPRQFSTTSPVSWPEEQSARALHSGGPVQCSSRRSVTATFRFYPYRVRTLVRTKLMHENNLDKSPPENLRGTTRNQLLVVRIRQDEKPVTNGCLRVKTIKNNSSSSRQFHSYYEQLNT